MKCLRHRVEILVILGLAAGATPWVAAALSVLCPFFTDF